MSGKRITIVCLMVGLGIALLLAVVPLYKQWRVDLAIKQLLTPAAQEIGEVPRAVSLLREIGLDDEAVVSGLLRALEDDGARQNYWGAGPDGIALYVPRLFSLLAEVGELAVPSLIELLGDDDPRIRALASDTLEQMGAAATPAIGLLMAAANAAEARENRYSEVNKPLDALIKMGRPAVPALVASLQSDEHDIRLQSLEALYLMGAEAEAAAPALVAVLVQHVPVQSYAELIKPDGTPNIHPLRKEVKEAADALVRIGVPAVPALMSVVEHSDEAVRNRVQETLQQIELAE